MKLKEFMHFIDGDHVEIIDEISHGDVLLFRGLAEDVVDQEFLEWDVVTVHGYTSPAYANEDDYDIDFLMIFVKKPKDA